MTAASPSSAPTTRRRLYDLINVPLLGLVFLMFFLPQVKLSCGDDIHVKFSGPSLTLGTDPAIEGVPAGEARTEKRDYSLNPLFLLVPIGAVAGAVLFWLASQKPVDSASPVKLWQIPAAMLILLASYGLFGFGVERAFAKEMEKGGSPAEMRGEIRIGKTGWYYMEFLFTAGALALALMRRSSPDIALGGNFQIVPSASAPGSSPAPPPVVTPPPAPPPAS